MNKDTDNEHVHIKADDILPATSSSTPESQMLKRILEQMVENERQRIRNEFIRISLAVLVVLLLLLVGGFWLSRDILRQMNEERQSAERSWSEIIQHLPGRLDDSPGPVTRPGIDYHPGPDQAPAEDQLPVSDIEERNKFPTEPVETQNDKIKIRMQDMLKARDKEIQELRSRIEEQEKAFDGESLEFAGPRATSNALVKPAPLPAPGQEPTPSHGDSLTIPIKGDIPLRAPIPEP